MGVARRERFPWWPNAATCRQSFTTHGVARGTTRIVLRLATEAFRFGPVMNLEVVDVGMETPPHGLASDAQRVADHLPSCAGRECFGDQLALPLCELVLELARRDQRLERVGMLGRVAPCVVKR